MRGRWLWLATILGLLLLAGVVVGVKIHLAGKMNGGSGKVVKGESATGSRVIVNRGEAIAFLRGGNLWTIDAAGSGETMLARAAEGEPIEDFVWSLDGKRIYFCIGLRIYEVSIETSTAAMAGEVVASPGTVIDRVDLANDGRTLLVSALDADAALVLLAAPIGERESRMLTIDDYLRLTDRRPPAVRMAGEMSASPDGRRLLYKTIVDGREEIFVADAEMGGGVRLSDLRLLDGFEKTVETEGERRVLEAAWSPDGRYVIFLPMQSCSDTGFCYGRLHLVNAWSGPTRQLSTEMMMELPHEWSPDGSRLVYDDGERVVLVDANGSRSDLAEGRRPRWQPAIER